MARVARVVVQPRIFRDMILSSLVVHFKGKKIRTLTLAIRRPNYEQTNLVADNAFCDSPPFIRRTATPIHVLLGQTAKNDGEEPKSHPAESIARPRFE
jgi:hypothetical protein